ncbi:hypothetical protein GH714_015164 [Hevea brasiliensis]|uniref:HMA domain-containing protein n=1 Tax=Hevea brasiliensis TaxID=3981 RepID=A0A6A6LKX1_HEVBR|nr:hypothetical protein GH714_015164 [Hevea brasiliensis]
MPINRIEVGLPRQDVTHPSALKAALAEFISTLIFVFAEEGSGMAFSRLTDNASNTPAGIIMASLAHAFGLFVGVSTAFNISGGHVNPAVTFGAFLGGSISLIRGILYWIAQLLGSTVACLLLKFSTHGMHRHRHFLCLSGVNVWNALVFEIVLTFDLVYTVYATALDPKKGEVGIIALLAIGFVVGANILAGGAFEGASMNPAVSFGPALIIRVRGWLWTANAIANRNLQGVKKVKVDIDSNQLTVLGEVDPLQIQEELRRKFKKKVDIVSSYPKKGDNGTTSDKNKDDKKSNEEKPDIDKKQPKEALETTIVVVLKLGHYCQGCRSKIRNIVRDTNGVQEMVPDEEKEMITVKGTMDAKVLLENLKERLNGPVEILSVNKEKYSNGSDKESENGNDDKKKKKESAQENGSDDTEMEGSIMELKPVKVPAIMAVFKVPLHCDGCIRRIRKIIGRIRGVQEVTINKEEETVTVKATTDVNTLTETMKKRLKKLVEERKIEIQKGAEVVKDTSLWSFKTQDHKQESIPSAPLQFSEQQPEIIQIISVQDFDNGKNQDQSLVSSADAHAKLDSEIGDSSPTTETAEWAFLLASLFLEGVSAVLDQLGYLLAGMALSFVALLLSSIDLVNSARREGLIKMERLSRSLCFCGHSTNNSPSSELFTVVQCFGFTSAVWQCIYSTMQYIYALRNLDNPIK